jgi:hypothetical protein
MMDAVDSVIEETNGDGTTWAEPCPHVWKQSVDIDADGKNPSDFKDVELWRFFDWGRRGTGTESGGGETKETKSGEKTFELAHR